MVNINQAIQNHQNSTQAIQDNPTAISRGDFEKMYSVYLTTIQKMVHTNKPVVDSDYLKLILLWAVGSEGQCMAKGISKKKGLLLMGTVGCGKTTAITALRKLKLLDSLSYSCLEVSQRVAMHGMNYIDVLTNQNFHCPARGKRTNHIYFDDLGIEGEVCHFGNWIDVMPSVLTLRYNSWQSGKLFTHGSTNLTVEQLNERYGDRLFSRFREMFNLIVFKDSYDLRTTISI